MFRPQDLQQSCLVSVSSAVFPNDLRIAADDDIVLTKVKRSSSWSMDKFHIACELDSKSSSKKFAIPQMHSLKIAQLSTNQFWANLKQITRHTQNDVHHLFCRCCCWIISQVQWDLGCHPSIFGVSPPREVSLECPLAPVEWLLFFPTRKD